MEFSLDYLLNKLMLILAVTIAVTLHEIGHGFVAYLLGDDTAKQAGRLTLNPIKHIDVVGLICLVVFHFGWAKPVPINPMRFKKTDIKTGILYVSMAGPMTNIILCFIGCFIWAITPSDFFGAHQYYYTFMSYFIMINSFFAFFNLIPVPPLDGSKILASLLPPRFAIYMMQLERYGTLILLALIFFNVTSTIIAPLGYGLITAFGRFFEFIGVTVI